MNISKNKTIWLPVMLVLVLLLAMLPSSAFAADVPTVAAIITVEKKLTGDRPSGAEKFEFTLVPDDKNYPMPDGDDADTVTINGAGTGSFGEIVYSEPNIYKYTVKETQGTTANYTYDKTDCKVVVCVTTDDAGKLSAEVLINKEGSDAKSDKAVFTNSYKNPYRPSTGDTSNILKWILLAGGSATMILITFLSDLAEKRRHRKKSRQDQNN